LHNYLVLNRIYAATSIFTNTVVSIGFDVSLCCTKHPSGSRPSIILLLDDPSYFSAGQKIVGSIPCPRVFDRSHGCTPATFRLTTWAVKTLQHYYVWPELTTNQIDGYPSYLSWFTIPTIAIRTVSFRQKAHYPS
jgi:hypothetical protein